MESDALEFSDGGNSFVMEPPSGLAVTALERATPAEALLAFEDAVAVFSQRPTARNAQKVELTMRALRHHADSTELSAPERPAGP